MHIIWSWLNHVDMNLTRFNLLGIIFTCKVGINLCDKTWLDLQSNNLLELINMLVNMDHDRLKVIIDYTACMPLLLEIRGWNHYEEIKMMFSLASTLRHEHIRESKSSHIDGF